MSNIRILIVEDSPTISSYINSILENLGYPSEIVTSGEMAIQKADEMKPDLILMDIRLSGKMDGIETADQIKSKYNIPIIYTTAYSDDELLERAKASEPYSYLVKPIKPDELRATIQIALYRHRLNIQLKESEQRFRSLFHESPISLWEKDFSEVKFYIDTLQKSGVNNFKVYFNEHNEEVIKCASIMKVIDVNKVTLKLFEAESIGKFFRDINKIFCEGFYNGFKEELIAIAENRTMFECDVAIKTLKGNTKDVRLTWLISPGYERTLGRVIVAIMDITERKHAEEALRKAKEELEIRVQERTSELQKAYQDLKELDKLKSDFISSVSHELRTPLTSIVGFTKIVLKNYKRLMESASDKITDTKVNKYISKIEEDLNVIIKDGERLTETINDILDLSSFESGKVEWNNQLLNINNVIQESIDSVKGFFIEKPNIEFIIEIDDNLGEAYIDKNRVIQVIRNIISNAVKFTDKGYIRIKAFKIENYIQIDIEDTGIGINPNDYDKIFEKFKQAGDILTDKPKGIGLGLPISKEIIEHYNGKIWVESQLGKGSKFSFTIPTQELIPSCNKNCRFI